MHLPPPPPRPIKRQLDATILHFDYDCFYASVFEAETPTLRALPLAVQQKQIVVTCNYEARRRGLHKLQLIREARNICPDVVIVLGEDLTRFRNASKQLYSLLRAYSWNGKVERLGMDEVFMDISDIVEHNVGLLNHQDLGNSYFCLSKDDPTVGFTFDASTVAGYGYPEASNDKQCLDAQQHALHLRLRLGSHLAQHLRRQLDTQMGYTCTVGVSTNKLLAKLAGNLHKPNAQTTLLPPYAYAGDTNTDVDNVTSFIDAHEIRKIPGIGCKITEKLAAHVLGKTPEIETGLNYGATQEKITVGEARLHPGLSAEVLERVLGGPGTHRGIGHRIWDLLHGCDDTEVGQAREIPRQISIEDSYKRLDTIEKVVKELRMLSTSLIKRMHLDLLEDNDEEERNEQSNKDAQSSVVRKRWLAYPKTIRLSTRPRPGANPDISRNRSFARISRSTAMPSFVFSLKDSLEALTGRLVVETLVPLFRTLHPEKTGWNLSLVNVAATNMVDTASEGKGAVGRDISKMFRRQDDVLKQWRVEDVPDPVAQDEPKRGSEDFPTNSQQSREDDEMEWISDEENQGNAYRCEECGALMPVFAMVAHGRWHAHG
ncbi:DNA/RNA polymerase [Amniculicola lignicola CBS 123094]|uniref:DNA/RNA polymerase n=1 Tax=Amniculicola lignicola CBS 123094 TaxID=1392246 RepID=A0A6A5WUM0_9PLEO|nr:DNA/RNA polymerase [Amniculicola lignicola CBS 123094]